MTSYTALKQSFTPGPPSADSSQSVFGISFKVTSAGKQFDGWWHYCDITNGQGNLAEDFALWQSTGVGTGTYVAGSKVTSGNFVQGWNFIAAAAPIPLTNGQEYRAVRSVNKAGTQGKNYAFTGHFFDTGSGAAGAVNGPLTVFAAPSGSANQEPRGDGQQVFLTPATDVTTAYPTTQFNESWYGMDVQVSDDPVLQNAVTTLAATDPSNTVFIVATAKAVTNITITPGLPTVGGATPAGAIRVHELQSPWDATNSETVEHAIWMIPPRASISGAVALPMTSGTLNSVVAYEVTGLGPDPVVDWRMYGASAAAGSSAVDSGTSPSPIRSAGEFILGVASIAAGAPAGPAGWTSAEANASGWSGYQLPGVAGGTFRWQQTASASGAWTAGFICVAPSVAGPYRLFPNTPGPATPVTYTGNIIQSTFFQVKGGGKWLEGYWWWVCPAGQSTGPYKFALWALTSGGNGLLVPGSVVTSGTLTAGQWNYVPLPAPIQLAPGWDQNSSTNGGTVYAAEVGVNGNFPDTTGFWGQAGGICGPGTDGITNGPLFAGSCANNVGNTHQLPYGQAQGGFTTAGSDPAVTSAFGASTVDNFWVDVQISDVAPAGYSGSYRLYPNKVDANSSTSSDAAIPYTIATEVRLSEPCVVNYIWYYRPNGATTMASRADVWSISSGLSVASVPAPTWLKADGSAFASNATGIGTWAKTAIPGSIILPAGSYRVSVYDSSGLTDANWSAKDAFTDYFGQEFSGAGAGGIVNGPISAPDWPNASPGFVYGGAGTDTPPFSSGGTVAPHAQPVFAQDPNNLVRFPQLYAVVNGDESQNYFVDLEVTPVRASGSGLLIATFP